MVYLDMNASLFLAVYTSLQETLKLLFHLQVWDWGIQLVNQLINKKVKIDPYPYIMALRPEPKRYTIMSFSLRSF